MTTLSRVPESYDIDYVLAKIADAGVTNHIGFGLAGGEYSIRYRSDDFDAVQAVLDAYPTSYADDILRPRMLAEATALRWQNQQTCTFAGKLLPSDAATVATITAAVVLMNLNPESPQTRRWKTGPAPEDWVNLSYVDLLAMGTAIAAHVQACFDQEEALHIAINAADDVSELEAIDIETGWPG